MPQVALNRELNKEVAAAIKADPSLKEQWEKLPANCKTEAELAQAKLKFCYDLVDGKVTGADGKSYAEEIRKGLNSSTLGNKGQLAGLVAAQFDDKASLTRVAADAGFKYDPTDSYNNYNNWVKVRNELKTLDLPKTDPKAAASETKAADSKTANPELDKKISADRYEAVIPETLKTTFPGKFEVSKDNAGKYSVSFTGVDERPVSGDATLAGDKLTATFKTAQGDIKIEFKVEIKENKPVFTLIDPNAPQAGNSQATQPAAATVDSLLTKEKPVSHTFAKGSDLEGIDVKITRTSDNKIQLQVNDNQPIEAKLDSDGKTLVANVNGKDLKLTLDIENGNSIKVSGSAKSFDYTAFGTLTTIPGNGKEFHTDNPFAGVSLVTKNGEQIHILNGAPGVKVEDTYSPSYSSKLTFKNDQTITATEENGKLVYKRSDGSVMQLAEDYEKQTVREKVNKEDNGLTAGTKIVFKDGDETKVVELKDRFLSKKVGVTINGKRPKGEASIGDNGGLNVDGYNIKVTQPDGVLVYQVTKVKGGENCYIAEVTNSDLGKEDKKAAKTESKKSSKKNTDGNAL